MPISTIDGLASSLNTTEIIDALISAERQPAVLMENRVSAKTLEVTNFQALAAKLIALQTSMNTLNNKGSFSDATVTVSNRDILTASADSAIGAGTYSMNVLSLAQNHQVASQGFDDPTSTTFGTGTITIAVGDASPTIINIENGQNSLIGIKDAINDAKAGVTASIVNDGTDSNSYRLLLTGRKTGAENTISFTSDLTDGDELDFENSSFDNPEIQRFATSTTSAVTLGATAAFTGATNKKYTFTVAGNGSQTVGNGNITIDWTDGTNSGSIVVSQSDTEVIGPDGLKLSFADGDLTAGDTFTVSTFAPLLQQATDAQISMGSSTNGASPIIITSGTNTFDDVIPGMSIEVKDVTTAETGPVTISTGFNSSGVTSKLETFIKAYNDVIDFIDSQNKYNEDTGESGVLMGDLTLQTIQSRLAGLVSTPIAGLEKNMNALSAIGIRMDGDGKLKLESSSKLSAALEADYESVMSLFVDSGYSDSSGINFINGADNITGGDTFEVDITQVATKGYFQGSNMYNPSVQNLVISDSYNNIQLRVDGRVSDVIELTARTYSSSADLVNELQTRIDNDDKIGNMGVKVEWVDVGSDQGYIKINSSTYGSASKVELFTSVSQSAFADLNLSEGYVRAGRDVEGTINGQAATGTGRMLVADDDTDAAGLRLEITLADADLLTGSEGTITITKGVASVMRDRLDSITKSDGGVISRKVSALEAQIADFEDQISRLDERLDLRRETLQLQFTAMETLISEMQTMGSYLESQLEGISSNWSSILGKK
ncbi:MAG: flagellar filament capping protein FliD [Candidatus Zixiibacteriota bacterium]